MSKRAVSSAVGFASSMIALVMAACGDTRVFVGDVASEAGITPSFTSPDASDDDASVPVALCPSSKCPAPMFTCPMSAHPCDVDLQNDEENCGACGNACAGDQYRNVLGGIFSCVDGACKLGCVYPQADCDGIPDNGCETDLSKPSNCGGCGFACDSPYQCLFGVCSDKCQAPKVRTSDCGCVDLTSDDQNCGACGVACNSQPSGFDPAPPNAYYGCVGGVCDQLKCQPANLSTWADCNGDLHKEPTSSSDGCEENLGASTDHCGGCNVKCDPGQVCGDRADLVSDVTSGTSANRIPQCLCQVGETPCTSASGSVSCVDIDNDPTNCGTCGRACHGDYPHAQAICDEGSCGFACDYGWADCNDVESDGCETNVKSDPANCGACGQACEGGPGQACVAGKCLVEPCSETTPQ